MKILANNFFYNNVIPSWDILVLIILKKQLCTMLLAEFQGRVVFSTFFKIDASREVCLWFKREETKHKLHRYSW